MNTKKAWSKRVQLNITISEDVRKFLRRKAKELKTTPGKVVELLSGIK